MKKLHFKEKENAERRQDYGFKALSSVTAIYNKQEPLEIRNLYSAYDRKNIADAERETKRIVSWLKGEQLSYASHK